jgi:mutator protein MutT
LTTRERVVACVLRRGDRLLVCQRPAQKRHGGLWEFPGGKVEPNEDDERAATRELREELGIELLGAHPALFEVADEGSDYVIAFVPVEIRGEPVCLEHARMIWGTADELLELPLAPSDLAFVRFLHASSIRAVDG